MKPIDFEGLASELLAQARSVLPSWLPGGKIFGNEYVCAGLYGGAGESCKVNLKSGKWCDFATDNCKGGDLISLYAAIMGIKNGEAARRLSESFNINITGREIATPESLEAKHEVEESIVAPPANSPTPDMKHPAHGEPSKVWTYFDQKKRVLFYVARYDTPTGKQFSPWAWNGGRWVQKGWPEPRPLYNLNLLTEFPKKPVLICEGEKAADAAAQIVGDRYIVMSWPNGANAVSKVDWKPLAGRSVLIWPDADIKRVKDSQEAERYGVAPGEIRPYQFQPGAVAAKRISEILIGLKANVKILNVGIATSRPDGWDAADALEAGMTWEGFYDWAKMVVQDLTPKKEEDPPRPVIHVSPKHLVKPAPSKAIVQEAVVEDRASLPDDAPDAIDAEIPELSQEEEIHPEIVKQLKRSYQALWDEFGIATNQNGTPFSNVDNVRRVLEGSNDFKTAIWYDEFHQRIFTTWNTGKRREWRDVDTINLTIFLQREVGFIKIAGGNVHEAIVSFAHENKRNEPRDWMESLKWDGTPRIDKFLVTCLGAPENEYTLAVSKNFWVGMAARIFRPGCQLDNMVVLEGPQGIGKTNALRAIGGSWYAEASESVTSKDFFMVLQGKLIIEIAELDSFSRADSTRIKQVVTCKMDRYRAPYERTPEDHDRMTVFVGTTNDDHYLRDTTGGRRFWPVKCTEIHVELIEAMREQLFAEAVARFKAGENWYETPRALTLAQQEERRHVDEFEEIVQEYLRGKYEVKMLEVANHIGIKQADFDRGSQMRIAKIIRILGWECHVIRRGDEVSRIWKPKNSPIQDELIPSSSEIDEEAPT